MKKTGLVLFDKENTKQLLQDFNFKISKRKMSNDKYKEFVVTKNNEIIQCPSCNKEIQVKKVGTIAHGSRLLFCDSPLCFATWVANNKI